MPVIEVTREYPIKIYNHLSTAQDKNEIRPQKITIRKEVADIETGLLEVELEFEKAINHKIEYYKDLKNKKQAAAGSSGQTW